MDVIRFATCFICCQLLEELQLLQLDCDSMSSFVELFDSACVEDMLMVYPVDRAALRYVV
jgi:hypothetical protein